MEPTASLTVPSLYDGITLKCRIFHPVDRSGKPLQPSGKFGAIIAHPYAPLGGSFDDPIVEVVVEQLRRLGFVVGTFNFRGAGETEASTSWTANAELLDYTSFAAHFVLHLLQLQEETEVATQNTASPAATNEPDSKITLIYGGYSFGAMVASRMDLPLDISGYIKGGALERESESVVVTGGETLHFHQRPEVWLSRFKAISGHYLLISPLVGPVKGFLTLFTKQSRDEDQSIRLTRSPTLAIFGTKDTFTFFNGLHKWAEQLSKTPESQFQFVEVPEAGHFWHEPNVLPKMLQAIDMWVKNKIAPSVT